jgi:hypothetical protein
MWEGVCVWEGGGSTSRVLLKAVLSESYCATASCLALCSVTSDMLLKNDPFFGSVDF